MPALVRGVAWLSHGRAITLSAFFCMLLLPTAMSKSAVKISSDLLSNPLCEQEPSFLEMVTAFDTAMKRMDSFNQEKVTMGWAEEGETGVCWDAVGISPFQIDPSLSTPSLRCFPHEFVYLTLLQTGCTGD